MKDVLKGLNEEQKKFVLSEKKRILLLACAGSGKSSSTVRKIGYLLDKRISPEKIFAISFTRAASNELMKKITKINKLKGKLVKSMTFHSMCIYFLKKYINPKYSLINNSEKEILLEKIAKSFNISNINSSDKAKKAYLLELSRNNLLDIDLVPELFKDLIKSNKEFQDKIQNEVKCIFYDEAQDINKIQYDIINLIIPKESDKVLCFIGDFSQNIYSWNGTDNRLLIKFKEDHNAEVIKLNKNYRCSKQIIQYSNKFIDKTNNETFIDVEGFFDSEPVEYKKITSKNFEALLIAQAYKANINNKKLAIIARNNADISYISTVLSKANFEYSTSQKKEFNRYFLDFARLCINNNSLLLEKFINVKSEDRLKSIENSIPLIDVLSLNNSTAKKLKEFNVEIKKSNALKAYQLIKNNFNIYDDNIENEIIEFEKNFNHSNLENFLDFLESKSDQDNLKKANITCTTIHGSKGLEYDEVIIYNVNNQNFKSRDLEENLRLLYVATTRAISKLTITYILDKCLDYNKKIPDECDILKN